MLEPVCDQHRIENKQVRLYLNEISGQFRANILKSFDQSTHIRVKNCVIVVWKVECRNYSGLNTPAVKISMY